MKSKILILTVLIVAIGFACKPKAPESSQETESAIESPENQRMILANVYIKPEYIADFIEAAKSIIEDSNKEEGCIEYMLYQNIF